jgi:hypothetical protein
VLAHAAATWFMAGLIWFVQVVHYPLFAGAGRDNFADYARRHQARTTWLVGPPMLVEAAAAAWLAAVPPTGTTPWLTALGVALVAVIWLCTALVLVPCHGRLSAGFDPAAHRRLVRVNWVRTAAWSLRGVVALAIVVPGPP